ncbi:hypothetical protein ILUMI_05679, partial [Ignelater luminosus]
MDKQIFQSKESGLSVAVPGALRGHEYAHKRYGKLPWAEIIRPTIELCRKGHLVTEFIAKVFKQHEENLLNSPTLREIFINPNTNKPYGQGQLVKRLKLAETLEIIAKDGAAALYDGRLTAEFVRDIKELGGIITAEDMKQYKPLWRNPIVSKLPFNQTLYTIPLPGAGTILTFILNILSEYLDLDDISKVTNWQRIVESFKYAYGKRTELGDPDFVPGISELIKNLTSASYAALIRRQISDTKTYNNPQHYGAKVSLVEDKGTANIVVIASNGDAVSVTSTINR